jgi:hypothetical protein
VSEPIRLAVCYGDTHTGSKSGLFLPGEYELIEGERRDVVKPNDVQLWLNAAWERLWGKVFEYVGTDDWVAIHTGDAVHGNWSRFDDVMLADMADQIEVAYQINEPKISRAKRRFMTRGSSVHSGRSAEATIAKKLNFEKCPNSGTYAPDRWRLKLNGWPFVVKHHIPVTSREYLRTSQLGIELANEKVAAANRGYPIPNGLLAAHRHVHDVVTDGVSACHVNGPWMLDNRYSHTKWSAMMPEPTLTVLDSRRKEFGQCPHFEVFKATPPPPKEVEL